MARYKLGCGTWPYMFPPYTARPYTIEECLQRISVLKFEGVEISGFKPHAHPDLYPTKRERDGLLSLIKGYNLEIVGYAADLSEFPLISPYSDVRKAREKKFNHNLKFCADLEINAMRVDTVSGPGISYEAAGNKVVEEFKKYAVKAQDVGVGLVWEFEPGFMLNKLKEVEKVVNEVDHPNFKLMVDTCHAHCCGIGLNQTPPLDFVDAPLSKIASEVIRRFKGKIGHIHLIDSNNTLNPHNTSTHAPFGLGVIDFDEAMKAIMDIGYSGWLSLDLCFWPRAWEETENCKKFLNRLVAKYQ